MLWGQARRRARKAVVTPKAPKLPDSYTAYDSYDFLSTTDRLAQLLHCPMESVACPILQCAETDSNSPVRATLMTAHCEDDGRPTFQVKPTADLRWRAQKQPAR